MSDANRVRVAAAQYDIGFFTDWTAYADKLSQWVGQAAAGGAQLLVFPEYGAMELVSLFTPAVRRDLAAQLEALQALRERFLALHTELAVQHRVHILAASFPVRVADGGYRNRAHLFGPGGGVGYQDKLQMTRFENEQWLIRGGDQLRVFDTALGRLGVAICYDAEFPLPVRTGCLARALENQCYVIQAPTVGEAGWSEAVDVNVGAAAVYTPADRGFPDDGVLAVGPLNTPQWVFADLSAERIAAVRRDGQVLNHRDWSARNHSAACDVDTVSVD
jgi:predicted amidohydrolase